MLIDEYVTTNYVNFHEQDNDDDNDDEPEIAPLTQQKSMHAGVESTDQIMGDLFSPIALNPSVRSTSFGPLQETYQNAKIKNKISNPHKLLDHILIDNEFDIKFESIDLLQQVNPIQVENKQYLNHSKHKNKKQNLSKLDKIKILSLFGHNLPYRENIFLCVTQYITIKYQQQIYDFKFDKLKIKQFARKHCQILLSNILFTNRNKKGIIPSMRRLLNKYKGDNNLDTNTKTNDDNNDNNKKDNQHLNVYRCAALILQNVYNITIPFPM